MSTLPLNLYRVTFKVKPSTGHPKVKEMKFAWLHLICFDFFEEAAIGRAETILRELPYQKLVVERAVYNQSKLEVQGWLSKPWLADCQVQAHACGFSFHVEPWFFGDGTGDEAEFIKTPFPNTKDKD